jgi:hypothetical protein
MPYHERPENARGSLPAPPHQCLLVLVRDDHSGKISVKNLQEIRYKSGRIVL